MLDSTSDEEQQVSWDAENKEHLMHAIAVVPGVQRYDEEDLVEGRSSPWSPGTAITTD